MKDNAQRGTITKALLLLIPVLVVVPLLLYLGRRTPEEKPSFYKEPMKESDVWRLPVVEPYELITAYCCVGWNWQKDGEHFAADSVNYAKGYLLYCEEGGTYGFLDTQRKRVVRLPTHQALVDSLAPKGVTTRLYRTENVYRDWVNTGQLPWASEILADQAADK